MIAKTTKISGVDNLAENRSFLGVHIPDIAYIAVENGRCPKADVFVKEGDEVFLGQVIGLRHGPFFDQPIHSTVSGKVLGIEKHLHRSGKMLNFIKIENDHKDTLDPSIKERTAEEISAMTNEEIIEAVKSCCVVGLGGSSFPTYIKLQTKEKIDHILINGIECEPYLSSDQRFMHDKAEDMIEGIMILQRLYSCKDARICIKETHPELIAHLEEVIVSKYSNSGIVVEKMKNFYPQGWEVAMIEKSLGIRVAPGTIPPSYGIMNVNSTTAAAIYYAVAKRMPIIDRYISVNGDGIVSPCDFIVRIGTPLSEVIAKAGGYSSDDNKILVLGGPMMGGAITSDDSVVTKCVTSVIVLNEHKLPESPCIRCGSCVLSCPQHLEPVLIIEAVKSMDKDRIKALNPLNCMECGLCTYSCTSGIRVTDFVRRAKILAKL